MSSLNDKVYEFVKTIPRGKDAERFSFGVYKSGYYDGI